MKNYTLTVGKKAPEQHIGGLFSAPLHGDGNAFEEWQRGRNRLIESSLEGIFDGSQKDIYGTFVPVGEGSLHELINWTSKKVVPDTSFFGWFTNRSVTTPLHANWPADTMALQLAGRKSWLMVDPYDMRSLVSEQKTSLYASPMGGVYYPNLKVDEHFQSVLKVAHQEAGDLFYFPPYAAHAVVSDEGLNVMSVLPRLELLLKPSQWFQLKETAPLDVDLLTLVALSIHLNVLHNS